MRKLAALTIVLALIAAACSAETAPTTTTTLATTTTLVTTTTIPPTTTSTVPPLEVFGAEAEPVLEELVKDIYAEANADRPNVAAVTVGQFSEDSRVAVVEAADDVTLAVADPIWRVIGGWWPSLDQEASLGTFPKIVAVIGSDARPGYEPLEFQADSIHFVGLTEDGTASVLGLPRDSWIPVPGLGNQKATSSLPRGGVDVMMEAFADLTSLEFDGYLLTGFEGFTGLIGVLGGLDIDVPIDLSDRWAQAYITAGQQILSPADALAFARVRKTISGGDFTRKKHGGLALIAAATMVKAMGPGALPGLMNQANGFYHTDLPAEDALLLAAAIVRADVAAAPNIVAPGYVDTTSGGASIVRLRDGAFDLFEDLADGRLDG